MLRTNFSPGDSPLSFEIICVIFCRSTTSSVAVLKSSRNAQKYWHLLQTLALNDELNQDGNHCIPVLLCVGRTYHLGHGVHRTLTSSFPLKTLKRIFLYKINNYFLQIILKVALSQIQTDRHPCLHLQSRGEGRSWFQFSFLRKVYRALLYFRCKLLLTFFK